MNTINAQDYYNAIGRTDAVTGEIRSLYQLIVWMISRSKNHGVVCFVVRRPARLRLLHAYYNDVISWLIAFRRSWLRCVDRPAVELLNVFVSAMISVSQHHHNTARMQAKRLPVARCDNIILVLLMTWYEAPFIATRLNSTGRPVVSL